MQPTTLILILLILSAAGYYLGRKRALRVGSEHAGGVRKLHSLPSYHGYLLAIWAGIPALIILSLWLAVAPQVITQLVVSGLPEGIQNPPPERLGLVMNDIRNMVEGNIVSGEVDETMKDAAAHYTQLQQTSDTAIAAIALLLSAGGIFLGWKMVSPRLRARRYVEKVVTFALITCSTIAIFTTLGIVLSLLFEAMRFFRAVPVTEFLFGLEWSPQTAIRADQVGANPLEAVTTVTVQIVTLLTGDQEFDSPKTLAAFALGLLLFTITLILNVITLHVVRKYREQYE